MKTAEQLIDDQVFTRITSLFAVKRSALAPHAVERLTGDIVQLFARAAARAPRVEEPVVSEEDLATFCDLLVQPEPAAALQFIETRRGEGVTRQDVYLGYIAPAARLLGERWDEDRVSFTDVAVGTGHLYALMRALRGEEGSASLGFDPRRRALFATVPGEDHGIGITIAADLFRNAGWEIDLQIGANHGELIRCVEMTLPQIIGLSLSTERRLDDLVRLVVAMRIVVPHAIIGIAPGGTLDENKVGSLVDIDLLFRNADAACRELDQLIRSRGRPEQRHHSSARSL
jgi:methanogenic corrinoid protein MtbC1